jgi:hypothetical protein
LDALLHESREADTLQNQASPFRAPESAWDKITDELGYSETEQNRDRLKWAISLLPVYQAPQQLWSALRNTLDGNTVKVRRIQPIAPLFQRVAAVAAVLLLFGGAWWTTANYEGYPQTDSEKDIHQEIQLDEVEILYSEEAIHAEFGPETIILEAGTEHLDPGLDLSPEDEDQRAPGVLPEVWLRSEDPAMQALVEEWKELTQAQTQIRKAIGAYNDDPRWVQKIMEIERSRARLAKAMLKAQ